LTNFQPYLILISQLYSKWRIKLNNSKSIHTTFTVKYGFCSTVSIDNILIPQSNTVKYLGLSLDKRLTWNKHIRFKRQILNFSPYIRILKY